MNKHFKISMIKSIIRILGSLVGFTLINVDPKVGLGVLCLSLLFGEVVGILEEVFDERK